MDISDELMNENLRLMHAMQSGVAMEMNIISKSTEPKHLRVGINNALCEASAIGKILVDKGICTGDEYMAAINYMLRQEVRSYEDKLTKHFGKKVTLG